MQIVQINCLGSLGKFGNAIGEYLTVKAIADYLGAEFRCSKDWIGRKIFDIEDGDCISSVKFLHESDMIKPDFSFEDYRGKNLELYGFFQNPFFYKFISRSKARKWLQFKDECLNVYNKETILKVFNSNKYVGCHLRRGDMLQMHHSYPVLSEGSYIRAIHNFINDETIPIIWVSEETACRDSYCEKEGISFIPDFMKLHFADYLFRANSTFSFWAGFLGYGEMYSPVYDFPDYGSKVGIDIDVEFVPGFGVNKEGIFKP